MGLLDPILGRFNSGQIDGYPADSMIANAPSSGYLPEDQVSTPPTDPGGNAVGGPAPGGLAAALGLNPDAMRRISAGLAGGLSNVKNAPFAGQVAANAAGGAFEAGNKSDETAINQALKLQQIMQKAPVIDEATRRAAQADRAGTLAQARDAVARDPGARAAIIARLSQLGIAL